MTTTYRICSRCIMDTTDPDIRFDTYGVCSHCHRYDSTVQGEEYLRKRRPGALDQLFRTVKEAGKNSAYDCIIGVSGGVDSTYTAHLTKELGLRPLAVHLDNGWDSELAVSNIEKALKKLDIDLHTEVLDWEEFRDLQLAFLRSSTPDSEIPTDHAILALLYRIAAENNVRFILSGHNTATEGGGVAAWSQGHADWGYIKGIQKRFGTRLLLTFPHYGPLRFLFYTMVRKIQWVPILDYIEYDKTKALSVLQDTLGWKDYGGKHYESIYTRFYQGHILPAKFGFNKKRLHLSSLVWSGQLTREAAIAEMGAVDYPRELQQQDRQFVIKKLELTEDEFERIMSLQPKSFWDYPSYKKLLHRHQWFMSFYHSLKRS